MSNINYIVGDATLPIGDGNKIIPHICNDIGGWGRGFVLSLSKRWSQPEEEYRNLSPNERTLGSVMFIPVTNEISVANMIGQHDIKYSSDGLAPIRYNAVRKALISVNDVAIKTNATVHMPRIGTGLAGGQWGEIEKIIKHTMSVDVYVYDLI
jgi:O-acetyl-ADP-ribose deacetylase (regulator of RNase III)